MTNVHAFHSYENSGTLSAMYPPCTPQNLTITS